MADTDDLALVEGDLNTLPKAGTPADESIADLKARLERSNAEKAQEKAAREEAERRAREAAQQAAQHRSTADKATDIAADAAYNQVVTAIDSVQRESEQATRAYQDAAEAGDYKGIAKATSDMTRSHARLALLESQRDALKAQNEQRKANPTPPANAPRGDNPFERYVSTLGSRGAAWVRTHPDTAPNGVPTPKLMATHYAIIAAGIEDGSDEYFSRLDQGMGFGTRDAPPEVDTSGAVIDLDERRPPPAAAPVSRSVPSATQLRPGQVRLSAQQLEAAEISGMTPAEYAKALEDPMTREQMSNKARG